MLKILLLIIINYAVQSLIIYLSNQSHLLWLNLKI